VTALAGVFTNDKPVRTQDMRDRTGDHDRGTPGDLATQAPPDVPVQERCIFNDDAQGAP